MGATIIAPITAPMTTGLKRNEVGAGVGTGVSSSRTGPCSNLRTPAGAAC